MRESLIALWALVFAALTFGFLTGSAPAIFLAVGLSLLAVFTRSKEWSTRSPRPRAPDEAETVQASVQLGVGEIVPILLSILPRLGSRSVRLEHGTPTCVRARTSRPSEPYGDVIEVRLHGVTPIETRVEVVAFPVGTAPLLAMHANLAREVLRELTAVPG